MASGLRLVLVMAWQQDTHIRMGRHLRLLAVVFVLALATACSRQSGLVSLIQPARASHDLPFNRGSEASGLLPTQAFASSSLPVGTPIVVRLTSPLSSAKAHPGDSFDAVLDKPILVQDQILVQRGAQVRGRVAAAKPCDPPNHAGYLRLTLSFILNDRNTLPVHTSSIFAKGSAPEVGEVPASENQVAAPDQSRLFKTNPAANAAEPGTPDDGDAKFSTAQRLTFRLLGSLTTGR